MGTQIHSAIIVVLALLVTARGVVAAEPNCLTASPFDTDPDDEPLNDCLARGGEVILERGSSGYIIATGLSLTVNNTIVRPATEDKVMIRAHRDLFAPMLNITASGFDSRSFGFGAIDSIGL